MARTVLRSRSGDIVTAIQMTDRTGIVAASAPPAAEDVKPAAGAKSMRMANSAGAAEPAAALDLAEGAKLVDGVKPADRHRLADGLTAAEGSKAAELFKAAGGLGAHERRKSVHEAQPTARLDSRERFIAAAELQPVDRLEPLVGLELVKGSKAAGVPGSTAESESVDGAPSTLVAMAEPQRPVARRIRRNIVFTCAAALFLVVGWIGGGTWGHHESGSAPAAAVGAVADQEQGGTKPAEPPATTEPAPVPPVPEVAPSATEKVTPTTKRTAKASAKTTSASATADARVDTESSTPTSTARNPTDSMTEQMKQLLGAWSWNNAPINRGYGSRGNGR